MNNVWVPDKSVGKWKLPRRPVSGNEVQEMACGHFQQKYDRVQGMIMKIGCMDELLSGTEFSYTALRCMACDY